MNNSGENNGDLTDQFILKDLDCRSDMEPSDHVFDDDEVENNSQEDEDEDDDPEALADLEQRKDEIIEEFFAIAI
jgi:phosphodiesterase/alkaline phosphatase D-like protein